jgi:lipoprotein-anchoring transpeptidase ErfK/SrfK
MLTLPAQAETHPKAGPSGVQAGPAAESSGQQTAQSPTQTEPQAGPNGSTDSKPDQAGTSFPDESGGKPETAAEGAKPDAQARPAEPATPKSSILVNIDKSVQEMTVFVDGVEQYRWPVSTGIRGYSTPSGTFQASSMNKIWYSKQWDNAPMPHAIFFTKKGHAIHGTLEEKRLGSAASHGCVRLSRANAATLFSLVEKNGLENTQVVLVGTTPGGEAKVATQGPTYRYPQGYLPPWFEPGAPFYAPPGAKKRRGLFGRRWFQPNVQGYYYPPPRGYPRGIGPRGY